MRDSENPLGSGAAPVAAGARIVAFFDVDGTLVEGQAIWKGIWAYHFAARKRRARLVSFFLQNLARWALHKVGLTSRDQFVAGWGERLAAVFAGLAPAEAREVFEWVWENSLRPSLRQDVVRVLSEHRRAGHAVILVSATLEGLVEVVAERLGADHALGSRLELQGERYSGRMLRPLCFGPHKATRAREVLAALGAVDLAASYSYADSGHDAPLLELVGHPTAVYPDPALLALAQRKGWPVLGAPQK